MQNPAQTIPILPSRAIPATVAFYQRLGFEGGPHHFDKPWGLREFALLDIDGNLIRIGEIINA